MKRPKTERRCKAKEYCVKWKSGAWGQCDRSCSQTRIISCRERHTKKRLPDAKCENLEKPKNKRGCNKCIGGKYRTSSWSPCPATCKETGSNLYQYRKIECVNSQTGEIMHHNGCRGIQRPAVKKVCQNIKSCEGIWEAGPWGPCSTSCGPGHVTRTITCQGLVCNGEKPVETDHCDLGSCYISSCSDIQRIKKTSKNGNYQIHVSKIFTKFK